MKINYLIIPIITIVVTVGGSLLTSGGMSWYKTLNLPDIAPPGSFIGMVWTIIYILTTISAIIFWNRKPRSSTFQVILVLFFVNAFLNFFWSFLFFTQHQILWPIIEMIILELTVLALIFLLWSISKLASLLLLPYAVWVAFATYLAYQILILN